MNISTLLASLVALIHANPALTTVILAPLFVLLLDVVTGAARAIKQGSFRLELLADFAGHSLGKYLSLLLTGLIASLATQQGIEGVLLFVHGSLAAWYLAQIASIERNLSMLFGADDGYFNGAVTSLLAKLFGANQPHNPSDGGDDDAGPAAPVAASAQSLADVDPGSTAPAFA